MKCACVDPNAFFCYRQRYNIPLDRDISEDDEICSCVCHERQEFDDGPGEDSFKETGIIFSTPMVRAIMSCAKCGHGHVSPSFPCEKCGSVEFIKTMTRRIIKPQPWTVCPFGIVGDKLYVRETHYRWTGCGNPPSDFVRDRCYADHPELQSLKDHACLVTVPSILMPKWVARIWLEIVGVKVERLQEITMEDARREGADQFSTQFPIDFKNLWESLHGRGSWNLNPWVWCLEFRRIK